jgi:hypothetical protein
MLFEPGWRKEGSNFGAGDAPRAFLFRPTQHPDPSFGPNQSLHFELRLFGQAIEVAQFFIHAFQSMMRQGLQGIRVHLYSVHTLDWKSASQGELVSDGKLTRSSPHTLADLHMRSGGLHKRSAEDWGVACGRERAEPFLKGRRCGPDTGPLEG